MDARERLRRYLEQRRDLGESELILDALSVEDVMRLLGAGGGEAPARPLAGGTKARGASLGQGAEPTASGRPSSPPRGEGSDTSGSSVSSGDWRRTLQALDASKDETPPGARPSPPHPAAEPAPVSRVAGGAARSDAERAPAPPPPTSAEHDVPEDPPSAAVVAPAGRGTPSDAPSHATRPMGEVPTGVVIGGTGHELFDEGLRQLATLDEVAEAIRACRKCPLHATAKQGVPGEGSDRSGLVCVGEAPGANEDETGRPFVGPAGQLLTKILAAIELAREDVFIVNVLKHRPPGNRNPLPPEVAACSPFLVRQLELLRPRVLLAFGTFAAQTLLQTKEPIGRLRGHIHRYHGVPLVVTYHPAALLRNPAWKRPTWEDVQLARRLLDLARDA